MKKILLIILVVLIPIWFLFYTNLSPAFSDELDEINKEIAELQQALDASKKATVPLESQLNNLTTRLDNIQARVSAIEVEIEVKRQNIAKGYLELGEQQESFNLIVKNSYIKTYSLSPLLLFFSSDDPGEFIKFLTYQKQDAERDKSEITSTALKLVDLEERKAKLEEEEKTLASIKASLDKEREEVAKIVDGAKAYQADLSNKIAVLTTQQQQLVAQKLGSLNLPSSLGAGPLLCVDDRDTKYNPGFSPAFAFFTFGIPHRVGMNQYGALGRAQSGQGHEDILRAYFEGINFENRDNININVQGYGSMPIETYLLGIYEMPESWPLEALKAQAIAARSYALATTNNGANEICTTQSCQVYKQPHKSGQWVTAVQETAGKVMTNGGQVITAWYASTAGGYTFPNEAVWGGDHRAWTKNSRDTTGEIGGFSDLFEKSYDKESPCAYAAQGSRSEYNKSAWLKPEEVADIANVILLVRKDSSVGCFVYQTDKTPPPPDPNKGCSSTDNWSADRVRQELSSRQITPFTSVSNVSISADFGAGRTTNVSISGNKSESFTGDEFKNWFNLRAPANIQIVGPLYNIEKK